MNCVVDGVKRRPSVERALLVVWWTSPSMDLNGLNQVKNKTLINF